MAKSKHKPPDTYTGSQTEWDALSTAKQYRLVNKVKIATRDRVRRVNNKGSIVAARKPRRAMAPPKHKPPDTYTDSQTEWDALSTKKQYHIVNRVKINTRTRIRNAKNPGKMSEKKRMYRSKNPELYSATKRKWKTENKERVNSVKKVRRVTKREELYERIAVAVAVSNKEIAERA